MSVLHKLEEDLLEIWEDSKTGICTSLFVCLMAIIIAYIVYNIETRCYEEASEQVQYICEKTPTCSCVRDADFLVKLKEHDLLDLHRVNTRK